MLTNNFPSSGKKCNEIVERYLFLRFFLIFPNINNEYLHLNLNVFLNKISTGHHAYFIKFCMPQLY